MLPDNTWTCRVSCEKMLRYSQRLFL